VSRDRYGRDVLADPKAHRRVVPAVPAEPGLVVEVATGSFVGAVVRCDTSSVVLRDRRGRERSFRLHPAAFLIDDRPVTLVAPLPMSPPPRQAPATTASGSLAVPSAPARVARAARLLVEGIHDAELIERVWGDDLRVEGVVVEVLHGADDLAGVVQAHGPSPGRRLGVLLDHLVPGSKEARLAAAVPHPHVLVTGHPFVDVWAAVRPEVLGFDAWPDVPKGEPWKPGVARRLGFADADALWRHVRASVNGWRDLDRALIGAVERLIDFVTSEA
jgi:hypothetical protein